MNLYLFKTGKLVMAETGKPLEGYTLNDLYAFVDNPQDGDTLVYDGTAGIWKVTAAKAILPIAIEDPQDGDTLVYDDATEKWVNGAASGGGGSLVVNGTINATDPSNVSVVLDKTADEIFTAFNAGQPVIVKMGDNVAMQVSMQLIYARYVASVATGNYSYIFYDSTTVYEFLANAGADYPTASMQ